MTEYYDKNLKPLDTIFEWAKLFETPSYKIVKQEEVGKYKVSTVWLGLNHNFHGGEPLIFETMVFGDDEEDMERYSTEEEALAGHKRFVEKYSKRR